MALPEVERKVRQHGADIDDIWEILTGHSEDLGQIKETLANQGAMLTDHSGQLAEVRETLTNHGAMLTDHGRQLTEVRTQLTEVLALLRQLTGGSAPSV
jgi:hypothetical protein